MNVDVCIIGGGPSGAIASLELARLGFRVGLLQNSDTRAHWPETVSPRLTALLDRLGLPEATDGALCAQVDQKRLRWDGADEIQFQQPGSLIVDRLRFDPVLRQRAACEGVEIRRCQAGRPVMSPDGAWCIPAGLAGAVRARFIVIANGRRAFPRIRDGRRMVAYYGIAARTSIAPGTMVLGSTRHSWYWAASTRDGALQLLAFSESREHSKRPPRVLLREALQSASPGEDCAAIQFLRATDATARSAARTAGPNWIRTGDALLTVDPLSGSGLYSASLLALQAARVVNTILRRPKQAPEALAFYASAQADIRQHCAAMAGEFYDAGMRTSAAAAPNAQSSVEYAQMFLSRQCRLLPVPALVGDYVGECMGITGPGKRSIAFVDGQPVATLLAPLFAGKSLSEAAATWSRLSLAGRENLMQFLVQEKIVVPFASA